MIESPNFRLFLELAPLLYLTNPAQDEKRVARQNVIFELGYFIGKLGRNRVCALHEEGVDIPFDYTGVLYIPMDPSGGWKILLAREIKQTGIEIDLNKAL